VVSNPPPNAGGHWDVSPTDGGRRDLFGAESGPHPPKGKPKQIGIEFLRLGDVHAPDAIRVRLVDRETGKHLGSKVVPWDEIRDMAWAEIVLVNVDMGVFE
jgi:hypothetical protein